MKPERAYTFIEILAALLFLAILVPAVVEGVTLANRAFILAERGALAAELAQGKLNELTLDDAWATAAPGGDFGADWSGMRWEMAQSAWETDAMTVLTVTVFFTVQGREQNVRLDTLVNPAAISTGSASLAFSTGGMRP